MALFPDDDRSPVVVAGYRTPFLRSGTDFKNMMAYDLARIALKGVVDLTQIEPEHIDHVIFGCVLNQPRTTNVAREALIGAGLPLSIPSYTVTMACISSNQAVTQAAEMIARGQAEVVIAGGTECLSDLPILLRRPLRQKLTEFQKLKRPMDYLRWLAGFRPRHLLPDIPQIEEFSTGLSMGQSADRLAARWQVSRQEQDQYAMRSHHRAALATQQQILQDEILKTLVPPSFKMVDVDNGFREDTSMEKLGNLKPAFYSHYGTITAGNSSFPSDGAAAALLMSRARARELGYIPLAKLTSYSYVGCDPMDELLLGPAYAIPRVLGEAGLRLEEIDVFEMHEAFAGQILANLRALNNDEFCREKLGWNDKVGEIPIDRLNLLGGSLSLGHPFGATGIRLLTTCCNRLHREEGIFGLISSCAAGGLGHAMVIERFM
jgi:acetyl-CoA acetyltransferase family protein